MRDNIIVGDYTIVHFAHRAWSFNPQMDLEFPTGEKLTLLSKNGQYLPCSVFKHKDGL